MKGNPFLVGRVVVVPVRHGLHDDRTLDDDADRVGMDRQQLETALEVAIAKLEYACWEPRPRSGDSVCRGCITVPVVVKRGAPLTEHHEDCWVLRILKGEIE